MRHPAKTGGPRNGVGAGNWRKLRVPVSASGPAAQAGDAGGGVLDGRSVGGAAECPGGDRATGVVGWPPVRLSGSGTGHRARPGAVLLR